MSTSIDLATVSLPAAGDIGFGTSASFPSDISALLTMTETSYDPAAVSSAAAALIQDGEQQASIDAALSGLAENGTSITDSAALAILASASALQQAQNGTAAVATGANGESISVASAPSGASGVLTNSVPASESGSALVTASGSGASGSARSSGSASASSRASGSATSAGASASSTAETANTGAHMVIPAILLAAPLAALL
ncbi:hypothetical protein CJU90_0163 [Yarrowia sp. C11]|nr:hypothetical protein CKK34_1574 [Yarrowia sp. E02]KAG5372521.1 hypothetical protein CJU90_0163 [Yarrowia sp. C11]